ncbi:cell envelope integrity protein TolA [Nevskia sp.]|uniref:cell envelope integrity protein TolA n=1 Tax=Nevskia sp. TaxID=1929292 RepID=UPI003F71F0F6
MILQTRHIVAAIALHLAVFGLLFSGVQCGRVPEPVNIIQGQLISANELPKPPSAPKAEPTPEPQPPTPEAVPPPPAPEPPKPDPMEAQRKLQAEREAKAEDAKKQQKAAEQKAAQEALLKKQADEIAEQKRLAEDARKKKEAEDRQREEELSKQAIADEEKRLAAEKAEKKKKAEQARREAEERRAREAELSAALGAESEQRVAADQNLWVTQIVAAIRAVRRLPPNVDPGLVCRIAIQLSATGEVINASVRTPSGNPQYDESSLRAVFKASPLPLPRDPTAFVSSIVVSFSP